MGWEVKILAFLAIIFIFYIGHPILFPLLLSFFLYVILNPIVDILELIRVPRFLATGIITIALFGLISLGITFLTEPAKQWINQAPEKLDVVEQKFSFIRKPMVRISELFKKAEEITEFKKEKQIEIQPISPSIGYSLFDLTTNVILIIFLTIGFLFFLLIYLKTIFEKLDKIISQRQTKLKNHFFLSVGQEISIYLLTFTIICVCLGITVGMILWLLGIPNAALWGVMVIFLNFIPYIGPSIGIVVIFFVSLLTFDSYFQILLPPLLYLLLCTLEGQIITPILLGHRLNINPLIVFFSIVFWAWLWGISGALLSVPLLSLFKIIIEHIPSSSKYSLLLEK